ncbi:MAG: prenyltransferase/squalene oxidase repeat-containing protein [Kiritimatiellia bacterium]
MDASIKALHKNFMEWAAGPVGSVTLHVVGIVALLLFASMIKPKEKDPGIEVQVIEVEETQLDELLEDKPPEELPDLVETITPPDVDMDMQPPEVDDFAAAPVQDTVTELNIASDAISPIVMKGLAPGQMSNRSGAGRAAAINAYGGKWGEYAEVAVLRALEWLRINQNKDGSWGTHDKEAMTALAILTYLAHGETTSSAKYGQTVQSAIRYLVARQNEQGAFDKIDTTGGTYSQAICVYAISEAYGMMRIPSLKTVMEKGVQVLINGQQANGGYDYKFAKGDRRDTSLGGWCCQAMKAAYIAGAENMGLHDAMEKAVADMKSAQKGEDGSFYYSKVGASHTTHSIAGVAVLSLQLLGHATDSETQRGVDFLNGATCVWQNPPEWPMYAWYYISQTKFHKGGATWTAWNNQFAPQFIRAQQVSDDGKVGFWNSAGLALKQGTTGREDMHPVYATTLAALTLQVYYRFLPTYKPIEVEKIDQTSDDDVDIEIM